MALWPTTLRIGSKELKLLVTSPQGDDVLKARLPVRPRHPRALLTLLEGVALWSGEPVLAVISAGAHRDAWLSSNSTSHLCTSVRIHRRNRAHRT
jgi:hypothetical protein